MNDQVEIKLKSAVLPLADRIQILEGLIESMDIGATFEFLSRKQLSSLMDCSERYIQDRPEFKAIERRIGRRVYYPYQEVKRIINQNGGNRNA